MYQHLVEPHNIEGYFADRLYSSNDLMNKVGISRAVLLIASASTDGLPLP